ncbi:Uncharacterised protein [Mycobacteroides abscessus subsp. massiliense]|nr:hypothetical protein CFA71_18220 [Mycobacteroides abscessus subsp. bolletii]SKK73479.1 Uncharacterised protein [Mycobacteroides abscessus subsp. massiliense]SKK96207.1 Uncharacterised protein [Mycobacteroides abscessus subsp. massiliense]SKL12649.1 Uncharacterised protein [Mycobacteroides abscessus subsp. massiliense]SKM00448.1 Uncharacterised protein [Mycobacteroides abscessus subsp. massiliense]
MRLYPHEAFPDLGICPDDHTPDLRPEKELPPTSTAKHPVEGQPTPMKGIDL